MKLTVLTPTYNRCDLLEKLYNSLENQTVKNFVWMIVDDGSSDKTECMVSTFVKEASFPVEYIKKKNGGKHTALNIGISNVTTELVIVVDSDDTLTPNAVEIVLKIHKKFNKCSAICGYSFLRVFPDGKINGQVFPKDRWISSYIEARINSNDIYSDKAEVFFSSILKKYPFPEYPGEKFLGEDIVWIRMSKKYKMVHINKGIYVSQYLNDGLTVNRRKNNIKSPIGCMNRAKEYLCPQIKIKYRIRGAVQYVVYGKFASRNFFDLIQNTSYRALVLAVYIPSLVIFNIWKRSYSSIMQ